jgi:hypothetical protein
MLAAELQLKQEDSHAGAGDEPNRRSRRQRALLVSRPNPEKGDRHRREDRADKNVGETTVWPGPGRRRPGHLEGVAKPKRQQDDANNDPGHASRSVLVHAEVLPSVVDAPEVTHYHNQGWAWSPVQKHCTDRRTGIRAATISAR